MGEPLATARLKEEHRAYEAALRLIIDLTPGASDDDLGVAKYIAQQTVAPHDSDMEFCQECLTPIECEKRGGCVGPAAFNREVSGLRATLQAIADMHPGDQPASSGLTEEQWLRKHIVEMRVKAGDALCKTF